MGARRHGQGGHLPLPLEMMKVFLLQMLSKTSVDEVFMHHFEKMSASRGFAPDPHWGVGPGPCWGTSVFQTPSLPNPGKNLADTHACPCCETRTASVLTRDPLSQKLGVRTPMFRDCISYFH